ncbi:MAG: Smr/MutS family protein [Raineya sp.]|nr:Smr/MutS family protein [Raineya sp.]
MNIGDKVRFLHSKEAGVVVAVKGDLVEVEIEDGFTIPVQRREIVLISAEESKRFNTQEKNAKPLIKEFQALQGIFLAFLPLNDQKFALYCLNNTDWSLPFAIHKEQNDKIFTIAKGLLEAKSSQKVEEVSLSHLETWGIYILQMIYASAKPFEQPAILQKKQKFRANQFKTMQEVPLLGKKGYLFQVDKEVLSQETSQNLTTHLHTHTQSIYECSQQVSETASIVDLHIDKLLKEYQNLSPTEILNYQLNVFEKCLDSAIANGLSEITFIHGVGNGTLRHEIHKRISKHPHVVYYKDAQKEKFGYGATFVKLK